MDAILENWRTSSRGQLLEAQSEAAYLLSAGQLEILWVNSAFRGFCTENQGPADLPDGVLGCSLLDYVPQALRSFYAKAYRTVLASGVPARHDYECSSLGETRWFAQYILPDHGQLAIMNTLLSCVGRAQPIPVSDWAPYLGAGELVTQCSHCRRIKNRAAERWELHADVFAWAPGVPRMSHGLCEICFEYFFASEELEPFSASGVEDRSTSPSAFRWLSEVPDHLC